MTDESEDFFGPESATFGDRFAAAREAAGMSQTEFARRLGVNKSTVRDWENDLKEPRANRLQMLAGILGVSITWLLTGEGDGPDAPDLDEAMTGDLIDLLAEMRALRVEIAASGDHLARLEKRLRVALKDSQ